jgi:amicyanin
MMPAPYNPSMPAQWNSPGRVDTPAAPAPVESVPAQSGPEAASSEPTPAGETVTVRIDGMRFEPASITVKPGTTVTWIQGSPMPHTITGNAEALRSNTLLSGQTYSHTFEAAGRYDYACDFHPSMKGSVIVEPAGRGT